MNLRKIAGRALPVLFGLNLGCFLGAAVSGNAVSGFISAFVCCLIATSLLKEAT